MLRPDPFITPKRLTQTEMEKNLPFTHDSIKIKN